MKKDLFERSVSSIEFFLNSKIFGNCELTQQITDHLVRGDLVVIRDAMQPSFAERMFACLNQISNWKAYQGHESHFQYQHHNIYDESLFPPDLSLCHAIFRSHSTKDFIQQLAQKDCSGRTIFSASSYWPGDYSLPHNDFLQHGDEYRQVAFIWHLTRDWQPEWGGDFFWCPKGRYVEPSFNTLLLFQVRRDSMHFVTQVTPSAQSKRLAISGWWTSRVPSGDHSSSAQQQSAEQNQLVEFV